MAEVQTFRLKQNLQVFPPSKPTEKVKIIDLATGEAFYFGSEEIKLLRLIAKMPVTKAAEILKVKEEKVLDFIQYLQKNNLLEKPKNATVLPNQSKQIMQKASAIELRPDLNFIENENTLLIEDPKTNRFFSLGLAEASLMYELMEKTVSQIADYKPEQIDNFIQSLSQKGLLIRPKTINQIKSKNFLSFFIQRFKLGNPDQMLAYLDKSFGWLWKKPLFILHLIVITFGFYLWLAQGSNFANYEFPKIFDSFWLNSLLLLGIICLILTGHEFAHGLALKSFGGSVPEMGVFLLYGFPSAYTNVSSAYKLNSKIQKVWVILAGVLFQVWIGALALALWSWARPQTWLADLSYLITFASFVNLAINLNPLIKLDGYYLLTLLLNKPNLRTKAYDFLFSGFKGASSFGEGLLFFFYAISSLFYTGILFFLLFKLAWSVSLQTAPFLSLLLVLLLILASQAPLPNSQPLQIPPLQKSAISEKPKANLNLFPILFFILIIAGLFLEIPYQIGGEVEVNPTSDQRAIIYAPMSGTIEKIYVKSGDYVKEGDKLVEIRDWQLAEQLVQTAGGSGAPRLNSFLSQIKQSRIQNQKLQVEMEKAKLTYQNNMRKAQTFFRLAQEGAFPQNTAQEAILNAQLAEQEMQRIKKEMLLNRELESAANSDFQSLKGQIQFYQNKSAFQTINSPIAGYVLSEDIDLQKGSLASPQQPLMSIANLKTVQVKIKVLQEELSEVKAGQKVKLTVRAYPGQSFVGEVSEIALMSEDLKKADPATVKDFGRKRWNATMTINNESFLLKPGMTGYAYIDSRERKKVYELILREVYRVFSLERFAVMRESLSKAGF